jgi:hypothetical protein
VNWECRQRQRDWDADIYWNRMDTHVVCVCSADVDTCTDICMI